jgi:Ca-activated chloride channel homolog
MRKTLACLTVIAIAFCAMSLLGCAKAAEDSAAAPSAQAKAGMKSWMGAPMAKARAGDEAAAAPSDEANAYDHGAATDEAAAAEGLGGGMSAPREADANAYYESTYQGGHGERERMAALIEQGIVVDGKQVDLAAFTRDYGQSLALPTDRALALSADTELAKIAQEGGKTYLQVALQAIKREAPKRAPLNIALVIDTSGSMGDERKLEYARDAAENVVDRLESNDRLAVVTYEDAATVRLPSTTMGDKARALEIVRGLRPGGSTNVHDGLTKGYAEVRAHLGRDAINSVILVSDGRVTAGPADPDSFRKLVTEAFDAGVQTTTVGMGLDFAEDLMALIAREGKGNYHFVSDASTIPTIFDEELGDLTHVVAKALNLRILLADDVKLLRVLGSSELTSQETAAVREDERKIDRRVYDDLGITMDRQQQPDEPGIKMVIPHFYMGDSHVVLLEIEVPPGNKGLKIADVYLKYKDLVFKKNREEQVVARADRADTRDEMVASVRRPVRKNRLGFETGEALLKAAQQIAAGQTREAVKTVDERMTVLGTAAREWSDTDVDRDHELLGQYRDVLVAMGTGRSHELGRYLAKSLTYSGYELTR